MDFETSDTAQPIRRGADEAAAAAAPEPGGWDAPGRSSFDFRCVCRDAHQVLAPLSPPVS